MCEGVCVQRCVCVDVCVEGVNGECGREFECECEGLSVSERV